MERYTIAIFGNRFVFKREEARQKLYNYLKSRIEGKRVRALVGSHGDFDSIALGVCRKLKSEGYDLDINWIFTSYKAIEREFAYVGAELYFKDVETMMYDIEEEYYKRQIIISNQKMVDESDEIIVYFDGTNKMYSGTYRVMKYAKKQNKVIINLYE